jgi:Putative zinc-finger
MKRDCKYETWLPDYIEGTLDEAVTDTLEEHLADCSMCLETATLLTVLRRQEDGFDLDPVPPELTLSALASIRLRTKGDSTPLRRLGMKAQAMGALALCSLRTIFDSPWQLSPARGPETGANEALVRVKRLFKGVAVEIEIEKTGPRTALLRILLPDPPPKWRNARVTLKRGRREIGSYPLNEGYVVIEDIDFGRYNLLFSRNGTEMGRYHFEIRETPHE